MTESAAWMMLYSVLVFASACADCLIDQITFAILCYSLNLYLHTLIINLLQISSYANQVNVTSIYLELIKIIIEIF